MADAHKIARCVRGCATDKQYTELVEKIAAAIRAAENDALERAAKWAEEFASDFHAEAIRKMKHQG